MAHLETKDRKGIKKTDFAYVDTDGEGHLPIHDESHVRNAIARFGQTEFETKTAKGGAQKKIVAAAKQHKIEVDPGDEIAKPVTLLRAAPTQGGTSWRPEGGLISHGN